MPVQATGSRHSATYSTHVLFRLHTASRFHAVAESTGGCAVGIQHVWQWHGLRACVASSPSARCSANPIITIKQHYLAQRLRLPAKLQSREQQH